VGQLQEQHEAPNIKEWKTKHNIKHKRILQKADKKEIQSKIQKRGNYKLEDNTWPFNG
jgi:hypothetical protein